MDVHGVPGMDDLVDLSNDEIFSSSTATIHSDFHCHASSTATAAASCFDAPTANYSDFPDVFFVDSDDMAGLEWFSNYMDDSITNFPANSITSAAAAFCGTSLSIRSRTFSSTNAAAGTTALCSASPPNNNVNQGESLINRGKENTDKARDARTAQQKRPLSGGPGQWGRRRCAMPVAFGTSRAGSCPSIGQLQARHSSSLDTLTLTGKSSSSDGRRNSSVISNYTRRDVMTSLSG